MAININPGSPVRHVQTFTSSGNFTPPAGTNVAFVSIHSSTGGSGSPGGGGHNISSVGGSSGTGNVAGAFVEVIPGVAHAIAIGAAGAGATAAPPGMSRYVQRQGSSGGNGGTTTFDGTALVVPGSQGGTGGQGGIQYHFAGTNGSTGSNAAAATGITSLTSLSPSGALTRTKTITQQATGANPSSGVSAPGTRYSGPAGTAGSAGLVHIYI
jgi:hypothetical protein